jgi:hypothetical protein
MGRGAFSSHFRCHPNQNPTLLPTSGPPHSRRHPGTDTGEDPIIRSRETKVAHAHKKASFHRATKPTTTHLMIAHQLIGHLDTTPACACVNTHRAVVVDAGWAGVNRSLTQVRGPSAHLFTFTCLSGSVHAYKPDLQESAWSSRGNSQCQC